MRKIRPILLILSLFFTTSISAAVIYDTPYSSFNTHVPQGTSLYSVITFSLQGSGIDETLTSIEIRNTSDTVRFGDGIKKVYLYLDEDKSGSLDTDADSLLSSVSFSNRTSSATLSINDDDGETLPTENSKQFIIAYDVDSDAELEDFTNITITQINTGSGGLTTSTIKDSATPTSNNLAITGIKEIEVDSSVIPEIAIPGQDSVPMLYFSVELSGTNEANGETIADDVSITIENEDNNFVTTSGGTNGVTAIYLYRENIPVNSSEDRQFNPDTVTLVRKVTTFTDPSVVTLNISNNNAFTEIGFGSSNTENYWIVYDVGDDISVTDNTTISAQLTFFKGIGSKSGEDLKWPIDSNDIPDASDVNIAGLSLVSISSIVPENSVFGAGTSAPILSFKLRSNHAQSTLNSVTILNPGTVPFIVEEDELDGVSLIELYLDSDRNESFNTKKDVRVGYQELPNNNTASQSLIYLKYEGTPTHNGVTIEEFDSTADDNVGYFGNNDAVFFVKYYFGESTGSDGGSNLSAIAQLGNTAASFNILLNAFGDSEEIGINLSDVDNSNPATANPEAEIQISSEINASITEVIEVAPSVIIEGQVKAPVLAITIESDEAFPSASFTITNPNNTFLEDNRGVTRVWVYKEDPDTYDHQFDSTDIFNSSTNVFPTTSTAKLNGISLDEGDNHFLVLYDFGLKAVEKTGKIQAQLTLIEGSPDNDSTLIIAGHLPAPTVPTSLSVDEGYIQTSTLSNLSQISNTSTYNLTLTIPNTTGSTIRVNSVSPKIYLDEISGNDISYQFTISPLQTITFPRDILAGQSLAISYELENELNISSGTGIIDAFVSYQVTSTMNAKLERYLSTNSTWISATATPGSIEINSSGSGEYYEFPSHIESIQLNRSNSLLEFSQYNAIKAADDFILTFKDSGSFIDESSIAITLNDAALSNSSDYSYDSDTGVLTITTIGDTDGKLIITLEDIVGNELDTTYIYYSLDEDLEIITPLFYPNPYTMGSTDLVLGFNLTQSATISYYLYDHNGVRVHSGEETFTTIGYNTITFDSSSSYLAPGIYVLKLVGEDTNGSKVTSKARLAIY